MNEFAELQHEIIQKTREFFESRQGFVKEYFALISEGYSVYSFVENAQILLKKYILQQFPNVANPPIPYIIVTPDTIYGTLIGLKFGCSRNISFLKPKVLLLTP